MAPWLRFFEAWMVQQLLRTPAFHRAVEKVAKNVHRVRHGLPPDEMGGTKIDRQGPSFIQHFYDELTAQVGRTERSQAGKLATRDQAFSKDSPTSRAVDKTSANTDGVKTEGAEGAWQEIQRRGGEPPKQGFMAEYVDALKEQIRGGKSSR